MTRGWFTRLALVSLAILIASAPSAFAQADPHAGHQQPPSTPAPAVDKPTEQLPPFIPPVTDEDRKAAFPDVEGHTLHDRAISYFVLFDQFEWQNTNHVSVDSRGWIGRDRDRLWFRAEGERESGTVSDARAEVLYGRQFSRWWDFVVGIRQDFRSGDGQTSAAFGVQGLAPQWFEIEATAYIGASGRTHARFELEYEVLLTNRLVVQPLLEAELVGKSDAERGIGSGLSTTDLGFRVRYEIKREVAPYVGILWSRKWGQTADFAEAADEENGGVRFVTGLRFWF